MRQAATPLVLHLTMDYPNVYRCENTAAVRNFINACDELDHLVIALTRTANPFRVSRADGDGRGDAQVISMLYWGLPFGILLALSMYIVSWRVAREVRGRHITPHAIHAHKLTFEGLAGWFLSRRWSIPLILSVRGEAESKVLRFKPHYRPLLQRLLRDASCVYYVSAWFRPILNRAFVIAEHKQKLLPNFVNVRTAEVHGVAPQPGHLVTVMDLNVYKKKGLDRLLPAFRECLERFPEARLDIVGRGKRNAVCEVEKLIDQLGLRERVTIVGAIPNAELLDRLPRYAGMALPSHNETFGMIYVESILANVPILYSKGTGIDGFLNSINAGFSVDPRSIKSIKEGISNLILYGETMRQSLIAEKKSILLNFEKQAYIKSYVSLVKQEN